MLKFEKHNPPANDKEIVQVEAYLAPLPKEYRSFLLSVADGGKLLPNEDITQKVIVNYFFSTTELIKAYQYWGGRIPPGCIPIAECAGNLLLIDICPSNQGRIMYWDHELENLPEGVTQVAPNFDKFIEGIKFIKMEPPNMDKQRAAMGPLGARQEIRTLIERLRAGILTPKEFIVTCEPYIALHNERVPQWGAKRGVNLQDALQLVADEKDPEARTLRTALTDN